MPAVMRMAVFMALKVVPTMAMATVTAMVIIRPKPIPGIRLFAEELHEVPDGRARCRGRGHARGGHLARHVDQLVAHHVARGEILDEIGESPPGSRER